MIGNEELLETPCTVPLKKLNNLNMDYPSNIQIYSDFSIFFILMFPGNRQHLPTC